MWLDVEQIKDTENLEKAVHESDALLIFLSKGYLASPFCRQELGAQARSRRIGLCFADTSSLPFTS